MYLRHTTVRKNGKAHSYWRLVRSVRRGRKVVQETVAQLGELDAQGRAQARMLALQITGRDQQYELFEAAAGASEPVAVRLDQVRLERGRGFGDVWLGWTLWRALELDGFCAAHLVEGRERVPWAAMAAILVIGRLCEPRANCTSPRTGTAARPWMTCWGCPRNGSMTTGCIVRSIGCCRTRRRWKRI
jgi:hypothetical protein